MDNKMQKVDIGLFLVSVQQSITAVGTFCDLGDLTIQGIPSRDFLAEILGESIGVSYVIRDLIKVSRKLLTDYESMPDGDLGRGLTNGSFLQIKEVLERIA